MRCLAIGAALLALSLTACGPKTEGGGETAGPAGFPRPTASYVATYKMSDQAGGSREMTIYASGGQMRVEGAMPGANITTATILDPASSQLITFRTGADAPKVAMTLSPDKLGAAGEFFDLNKERPNASVTGSDTVAGERCRVWTIPPATEGGEAHLVCATDDGILLRQAKAATPEAPLMEAVSVKRGAQEPALFAAPAGYEIVDYGPCLTLTQNAMAAMREGKRPDMTKMSDCQALGEKLGGLFGQ